MTRIREQARKAGGTFLILAAMSGPAVAKFDPTPEIDPGSMGSALALLSTGVLLLTSRRVKK